MRCQQVYRCRRRGICKDKGIKTQWELNIYAHILVDVAVIAVDIKWLGIVSLDYRLELMDDLREIGRRVLNCKVCWMGFSTLDQFDCK